MMNFTKSGLALPLNRSLFVSRAAGFRDYILDKKSVSIPAVQFILITTTIPWQAQLHMKVSGKM